MHDPVLVAGRTHRRVWGILEVQQHADLGADRLLVEVQRFRAAAVEIQIRLHVHEGLLGYGMFRRSSVVGALSLGLCRRNRERVPLLDKNVDINIYSTCQIETTRHSHSRFMCAITACAYMCNVRPARWRGISMTRCAR